ncbi:hypothetical protein Goshw_019226 [Gossypium schwendimanii]|uniref:Uncharacterized protein n=1 Tax=Gossypium schwendimanii TaxID=34291 RepID=A0A7J9KTL0_GOSSC|nr:hypothetical protein [Gossypium schwendimanii]
MAHLSLIVQSERRKKNWSCIDSMVANVYNCELVLSYIGYRL